MLRSKLAYMTTISTLTCLHGCTSLFVISPRSTVDALRMKSADLDSEIGVTGERATDTSDLDLDFGVLLDRSWHVQVHLQHAQLLQDTRGTASISACTGSSGWDLVLLVWIEI